MAIFLVEDDGVGREKALEIIDIKNMLSEAKGTRVVFGVPVYSSGFRIPDSMFRACPEGAA